MSSHKGVIRGLHYNGKECLNDLIRHTGLSGIRMIEFGAYAGEGTRIFAENKDIKEIWAISTYTPWNDDRCRMAKSNFPGAEEELDELIAQYPDKIHKFKGTLEDFYASEHNFSPDLIYIDERIDLINSTVDTALKMKPKFIAGHDYRCVPWYEVAKCVDGTLGGPDKVFGDTSWIKDVANIPKNDVAVCAIGRRENKYAREFVEHYKNLGFSHIYICDNNMADEEHFEDVLNDYVESGYVTILDYRNMKSVQTEAYNDCIQRYRRRHTWMAFFDFDELLSIDVDKSLDEILTDYRAFDCVAVSWKVYGDSGLIEYDPRPMIERFTEEVPLSEINYTHNFKDGAEIIHTKPIVRCNIPRLSFDRRQVHCPSSPIMRVCNGNGELSMIMSRPNGNGATPDLINKAYGTMHLKHFTTRTLEEWLERKSRVGGGAAGAGPYKDYFFKINKRTIDKDRFIQKWIAEHPDDEYAKNMLANYKIWISYHDDYLVWKNNLKEDGRHVLFPTHKDAPLENVNFMNRVWSELVTIWYVYHNKLESKCVGFSHYHRKINPSRLPNKGECAVYMNNWYPSIYEHYKWHNIDDMDLALKFIDEKYGPDNKYTHHIKHGHNFVQCNCFILRWEDFIAMCDFLFPILEYVSNESGCGMNSDLWEERARNKFKNADEKTIIYQTRAIGFLAERLTSAYINAHFKIYH